MSQIIVTASQGGGGGGALNTLTPSIGGVVSPTGGGTINILSGSNVTTTGTPGLHKITFDLINSPTVSGTMTALNFTTSTVATHLTINANSITTAGAAANVDLNLNPKGAGNLDITTATGGEIIFRGLTAGFVNTQWRTLQASVQTNDGTPTNIVNIPLANDIMVSVKALINGFRSDFLECVAGEILCTAYRGPAGDIILVGAPIINVNYTNVVDSSDIDANVNIGSESLQIQVIGVAAQTFNWVTTTSFMYTISNA